MVALYVASAAGVAVGSGWQALVAYVNLGTYYLIGVPLGIVLGWPLHFGVGVMMLASYKLHDACANQ